MNTKELARQIRISSLKMCHKAKASHIGGCLSCADILAVLYNDILKDGDRLVVSKGHCAAALYSTLALVGKIPMEWLDRYCEDGAELGGHVTYGVPGVEVSTGSLGHGLSIGCGLAIANPKSRIYVLMSDGEMNEGSIWESAHFASNNKIRNITSIIDCNGIQSFDFAMTDAKVGIKWVAFGWDTFYCDGHDIEEIYDIFRLKGKSPVCLVMDTLKGKGVSYMEGKLEWHYKYPDKEELKQALEEFNA